MVILLNAPPKKRNSLNQLMGGIASGAGSIGSMLNEKEKKKIQEEQLGEENEFASKYLNLDLSGVRDPKIRQELTKQAYKSKLAPEMQRAKYDARLGAIKESPFGKYFLNEQQQETQGPRQDLRNEEGDIEVGNVNVPSKVPQEVIYQAELAGEHGLAQQFTAHNQSIENRDKEERKRFEADRKYHTQFSMKAEQEAEGIRSSLIKKENSLNFARDAIESGDLSYFSKDKLADITGSDLFRTAKGAQLVTAGKENLLSNMSRVTGRAQNMWFEQRLNSMFPKIGQSKEANLTVQEMLEGELALDESYLKEFDKIAERDVQDYGYVKKDISKRANDAIKPVQKEIMQRTTYRMKEIEEQEKGLKDLKSQVGKNVPNGTPFTLAMAKLYSEKFGDNAIDVAKKNGYYIPTIEEFKRYRTTNQEMLEGL